jgi:hypothetical protein
MRADMSDTPNPIHADLAALADGSLSAERIAEVSARAERSRELTRELAEQREVVSILQALDVAAPDSLRDTIQVMAGEARPSREHRSSARRWSTRWSLAGAGALAAVAVVALLLALTAHTSAPPTVLQTSTLALARATSVSPAESPDGTQLSTSVDGVAYPYWGKRFGWRTSGARTDRLGGRTIMTVFYTDARSRRIGYSIVAGPALSAPDARLVRAGGTSFRVLRQDGATIVTWRRDGHTCVLAGRGVSQSTLLALAGWQHT